MPITSISKMLMTRRIGSALLPLVSPTLRIAAGSVSGTASGVPIGFTFEFDGASYATCFLRVAGYLRLAGTINSSANSNLFGANNSSMIAPWYDSLGSWSGGDGIRTETQGVAPWRRFVVDWHVGLSGTGTAEVRHQLVLYETTNAIEFRYGPRSASATVGSASMGLKGDTSVVATNYIDSFANTLALGGRNTSGAVNLTSNNYPEAGTLIRFEPNWPMCGAYVDIPASMLLAPNPLTHSGPDLSPSLAWRIANNTNWLYCRHMPALVNLAPVTLGNSVDDPFFTVPIKPSADQLTYEVEVQSWAAEAGTITLALQYALTSDPQPDAPADWTLADSVVETNGANYHDWIQVASAAIDPNATFLRFAFDCAFSGPDRMRLLSLIVRPRPLDDFDPAGTYASGFVPMGLGQLTQDDAAIHPEWLNRAYRNVARILADRWQALWSTSWPQDLDYEYTGAGETPVRCLGAAPCYIPWPRQTVVAEVYAHDSVDGGRAVFSERGGRSVTLAVNDNAGEYRLSTGSLELLGQTPLVLLTVDPGAIWRASYCGLRWAPNLLDEDLIEGLTPIPRLEYLAGVVRQIELGRDAWSMTGLATKLERLDDAHWVVAWVVPPNISALRPLVARVDNGTESASPTSIFADTSGAGVADEILVPSMTTNRDEWPPDRGQITVAPGAMSFDATPSAPSDRLLESPTSGDPTKPVIETARVTYGAGITVVPLR